MHVVKKMPAWYNEKYVAVGKRTTETLFSESRVFSVHLQLVLFAIFKNDHRSAVS